jgi:AraC-like DNA-binding protein
MAKDSIRIWSPAGTRGLEVMDARVLEHHWPKHFHDAYTIGFNLGGTGAFFCHGATQAPVPGSLNLINPGDIHTGQATGGQAWRYRNFLLAPEFLQTLAGQVTGRPQALHFRQPVVHDRTLAMELFQLSEALERRPGMGPLEEQTLILRTLGRVLARHADLRTEPIGRERTAVHRAKACLEDRFHQAVTLPDLAAVARLTPHHLISVFQREVGVPPHAYLNLVRANRAKDLLSRGTPIAEVALACGYCDQSHLNRWFRKIHGITPNQYRLTGLSSKNRQG